LRITRNGSRAGRKAGGIIGHPQCTAVRRPGQDCDLPIRAKQESRPSRPERGVSAVRDRQRNPMLGCLASIPARPSRWRGSGRPWRHRSATPVPPGNDRPPSRTRETVAGTPTAANGRRPAPSCTSASRPWGSSAAARANARSSPSTRTGRVSCRGRGPALRSGPPQRPPDRRRRMPALARDRLGPQPLRRRARQIRSCCSSGSRHAIRCGRDERSSRQRNDSRCSTGACDQGATTCARSSARHHDAAPLPYTSSHPRDPGQERADQRLRDAN
jgi:hypothetical protein